MIERGIFFFFGYNCGGCLEQQFSTHCNVTEVLNVHVDETNKKIFFLEGFLLSSEKLSFEKENVIFFNTC